MVVDDDDLSRRGIAELLADRPEIEVVGALTHVEALLRPGWDLVDVVIVDAADERRDDDQFPGVGVVEAIRAGGGNDVTVVVITGHFFDDAIRRRMREAGADFFYNRIEVQDSAVLYQAVLEPDELRRGVPAESDPETLFRLGVTPGTRVNAGVQRARELRWQDQLSGGAIRRARDRMRLRRSLGDEARLTAVNSDGRQPDRPQTVPSLSQIQRFLEWATRTKPDRRPEQ